MGNFVMKKARKEEKDDPIDQANLDLLFVEAFIDILSNVEDPTALNTDTISAMCLESKIKIERLQRFIDAIPLQTVKTAA